MIHQQIFPELNRHDVPRGALLPQPNPFGLHRVDLAGGHRVPEEDPGIGLRDDGPGAGSAQGDGGVLAGGAASEVGAGNDDGKARARGAGANEGGGVGGGGEADEGVRAELLVLVRVGRDEGEVLRGDDLVGVDVVTEDVAGAVEGGGSALGRGGRGAGWAAEEEGFGGGARSEGWVRGRDALGEGKPVAEAGDEELVSGVGREGRLCAHRCRSRGCRRHGHARDAANAMETPMLLLLQLSHLIISTRLCGDSVYGILRI